MNIKKNDTVLVITGKDVGKTSKVLVVNPKANKVIVDGVNIQKKHKKAKNAQEVSSIENQAGAIDASNVMIICPACGKATRVAYKIEGDKKIRICKKCGAPLDSAKEVKEVKKATAKKASTKATGEKKTTAKTKAKKAEAETTAETK